jgi:small subunit ribosomal protein S16
LTKAQVAEAKAFKAGKEVNAKRLAAATEASDAIAAATPAVEGSC